MASTPQFTATVRTEATPAFNTANTGRTGSGTIQQAFIGGTSGSRVERIRIKAQSTTTTGIIVIWTWDGSIYSIFQEVAVTAATPSSTVTAFEATVNCGNVNPLFVPSGHALGFSTTKAEAFVATVVGGDF